MTPLRASPAFDQLQGTLTRVIGEIDRTLSSISSLDSKHQSIFRTRAITFSSQDRSRMEIDGLIARTQAMLTSAKQGRLVREGLSHCRSLGNRMLASRGLFSALSGAARAIVNEQPGPRVIW